MKEIGAAKFKEQCLALLDNLDADGLIVTKRGKPVARVIPYETNDGDLIGSLRGKIEIKGDIFTTGLRWEANDQS
ncbi:MAG: type II toxin-antitoxin system prevent-host-death family antitoxin [Chloroflexi bacterium]|nr:type II toxin-antitoxin system prevent-host-death family antitoxin [Chloroflexota bacterium]